MTDIPELLVTAAALAAGTGAGLAHFRALRAGTRALVADRAPGRAAALTLARFTLSGAVLAGAALAGTLPLLAAAAGFALGRAVELRRARRGADA